ncbi:NmrA family transcriptional regulator [Nonomuraea sp. NPDC005650]|uniref:NmrA family transcriptional regulator n=1 Tax=Nonomuraea sp. NPDC005650 TaxID=3157045 RepID=UPI0033BEE115
MRNTTLTLVTGGTGKTGRRIVERLTRGDVPVRIGTRWGGVPFDWANRNTWARALEGVSAAYVSYYPDLALPGSADAVAAFSDLAVSNGVRRLVLLSGRGEEEARLAEKAVAASGAEWTVVRCAWFNQNFSESFLLDAVRSGRVALPVGPVGEPFVDVEDIADVASAALTSDRHAGEIYELTGPRLLTFEQAVAAIGRESGRDLAFTRVSEEEYAAALAAEQVPAGLAELIMYVLTTVLDGRNAHVGDGVQRALGREPRGFDDYARETASAGIWNS